MSAATVTEIYLVRHGETDWNRERRLQGRIDTPLNRIGLAQAHQVAERFRALTGATVVTSPLARALNTAGAIARANRSALVIDPLLAEIDHGSWSGVTLPTIERACPGAVINGHIHTAALDVSRAEPLAAAYCRASTALRRLVSASRGGPVVVVSHGVINALLMCAAVGIAPVHMDQFAQPNGGAYRLFFRRRVLIAVECAPRQVTS
ncbi:MAG TPA: histidine phosphatase family protein [Vicinamibacterales bacterium]|jgi:broad specificity phosphatase PhoE|nr:histidine phosphatase family protein [Vicinamibacterales bacterium]